MADFFDALYRWANTIAQVMFALDIVLFLPLSLIRPLRKFTGSMLVFSSFSFGLLFWLLSAVIVYVLWGLKWMVAGFIFLGLGVVPMALLASLFKAQWSMFGLLVGLFIVVFGARFLGFWIIAKGEKPHATPPTELLPK